MKQSDEFYAKVDAARVAVLFGMTVGLGIAVHESFFLVAGAIAVGALAAGIANAIQDHAEAGNHLAPHQR